MRLVPSHRRFSLELSVQIIFRSTNPVDIDLVSNEDKILNRIHFNSLVSLFILSNQGKYNDDDKDDVTNEGILGFQDAINHTQTHEGKNLSPSCFHFLPFPTLFSLLMIHFSNDFSSFVSWKWKSSSSRYKSYAELREEKRQTKF